MSTQTARPSPRRGERGTSPHPGEKAAGDGDGVVRERGAGPEQDQEEVPKA